MKFSLKKECGADLKMKPESGGPRGVLQFNTYLRREVFWK